MAELLDFDPLTGISHYFEHDEMTNLTTIQTVQDVEPVLEWNRAIRNDGLADGGIKKNWWLYAKIPPIVELKMRAKGINIRDPGSTAAILREINEHYPQVKTTEKWHGQKSATQFYLPPVSNADE